MHVPKFNLESLKNLSIFVVVVALLGTIAVGGSYIWKETQEGKRERKLILEGVSKANKKIILQQVVSEKMADTPVETVVAIADKLYERTQIYNMDLAMVCGMIEVESHWDVNATSNVGAKGLLQIMPATARPYLSLNQLGYSEKILFNPTVNITVGLASLYDTHQQFIEIGVEKETEYMFSLNTYFWGQGNIAVLLGKKDARVNGPNFAYAKRVMDAAKFYKDKGL